MAQNSSLSPIQKPDNVGSPFVSPSGSSLLLNDSVERESPLIDLAKDTSGSFSSNYSFLLLKKSREVDRLNEKLVVQEALTPHKTDDLFELFSESLKIGRAIRVVGNETIHKLHLLLKELETYEATENSNNTTKNVTAELEELNEYRSKDKRHNAAVLIQTFFRAKKVFYDERVNRIARFWRLYSCTMKLRLSAMCVMRCPVCKRPTPIELELANGNSAWAPKLKKSFSCAKCKSYILAKPIITKLPFTNPRIPVTCKSRLKYLKLWDTQTCRFVTMPKVSNRNTGSPGPAKNMKVY